MKKLLKITLFLALIAVPTIFANATVADSVNLSLKTISTYKVRVVITQLPDPSPTINSYKIVAYVYADDDSNINVPIPSTVTVSGTITWNGGGSYYPISRSIGTSGIDSSTFDVSKPATLSASNMQFNSVSTNFLGTTPLVFDGLFFW